MSVIIRTHGGLGNQIFQRLYSKLLSTRKGFTEIYFRHDSNYSRRCLLEYPKQDNMIEAKGLKRLLTYSFIPKIDRKSTRLNSSHVD